MIDNLIDSYSVFGLSVVKNCQGDSSVFFWWLDTS